MNGQTQASQHDPGPRRSRGPGTAPSSDAVNCAQLLARIEACAELQREITSLMLSRSDRRGDLALTLLGAALTLAGNTVPRTPERLSEIWLICEEAQDRLTLRFRQASAWCPEVWTETAADHDPEKCEQTRDTDPQERLIVSMLTHPNAADLAQLSNADIRNHHASSAQITAQMFQCVHTGALLASGARRDQHTTGAARRLRNRFAQQRL